MKKAIGICSILLSTSSILFAQTKKENPTVEATSGFKQYFPASTNATWEKEGVDYEVSFKQKGVKTSAVFDANGTLKETEITIAITALPEAATQYIHQHYAGQKIKESAKIVGADGLVTYEAEINKKDVLFDASGIFLKEAHD